MHSTKSSQTSWPSASPCMRPVTSSPPPLRRTPHSLLSSIPKPMKCMGNTSKKLMPLECGQSPKVAGNMTAPLPDQTLLERMGLGNQTLMARLGLLIRISPCLTQAMSSPSNPDVRVKMDSNELAMMRGTTGETMLGIGTNLEVAHHGKTLMRGASPLQRKLTFCRTLTSPISSEPSKTLSLNKITHISLPSSGKMYWQTNRLISEPWLRTDTQG